MGCIASLIAVPLVLGGVLAGAAGALMVVTGFRMKHAGFCQVGAGLGVVMAVLAFKTLGLAVVAAGGFGWWKYRKALPR